MIGYKIKNICNQTGRTCYCTHEENHTYHMVFSKRKDAQKYVNYWREFIEEEQDTSICIDMVYIDEDTHFLDVQESLCQVMKSFDTGVIRRLKGKPKKKKKEWIDPHLGCPSYPECDEMPTGCRKIMGKDVEMFGYRD